MKHHYIVMTIMTGGYQCPMGAMCTEDELSGYLKSQGAESYKIRVVDNEPVEGWEGGAWIQV